MLENADDIEEEYLTNDPDEEKNKWLLLLLFRKFDFDENLRPVFTEMLNNYSGHSFDQAVKEIKQLGEFNITAGQRNAIIESIVADRVAFLLPTITQATENMITATIYVANDVKALKKSIADSYAVSDKRVVAIKEIEYKTIKNITRIGAAEVSEIVGGVLVSDGTDHDSFCFEANGQVWSLDFAGSHILQHINCVREFTFLTQEEVEDHGGIDQE